MSLKSMLLAALAGIVMSGTAAAADFTFKYGNSQPEAAARSQSMIHFKNELEKRSDGRIEVQNFFGGVLGTEQEMFDQVATGLMQSTRGGFFANANPEFNILVLPFLVNNWDEAKCLVKSDLMMGIQERAANNGFHVPATAISQGFRMYTNNVRPITKVDDLKGLKIREPQTDAFIAVARALGSNVQAMAFSEVYQAFKQGVLDGQHNPPANIYNFKIYEVQKYLSVTNHMTGPDPLLVNKDWYDSLPADLQKTFDEVAVEAMDWYFEAARKAEDELLEELSKTMTVNYVDEAGLATFVEAVQPVYAASVEKGYFTSAQIEEARAAIKACM
jgi:C4-dicarboxylate-binding protein DctP